MKVDVNNLAKGIKESIKKKLGVADSATLILSEKRLAVCDSCEENQFEKMFQANTCKNCGCILSLKALSDSNCPLNKWEHLK